MDIKMIIADDGFFFGIGAFETIAVKDGVPILLSHHYDRLLNTLKFLNLTNISMDEIRREVKNTLKKQDMQKGSKVLKITVSKENVLISTRPNTYHKKDYEKGFNTEYSAVRRNETSPLTYHKTLNYGDCVMEKRSFRKRGIQEPIFLNTKGELSEGATTNIFFVKDKDIIAPPMSCGMLPGIIRKYIYDSCKIKERILTPDMIPDYDEMFLTNSLLGIMPVKKLGSHLFKSQEIGKNLLRKYLSETASIVE